MTEPAPAPTREARRGREARRSARAQRSHVSVPYITRNIPLTEILSEEGLALIEHNADTLLEEIGIEFREFPRALDLLRKAGCDIKGERVRFPRGLARQLCATTPSRYVQHARNPDRNVLIGGDAMVFAPNYGSPFVHDLDRGRRYGTIEDFQQLREARLSSAPTSIIPAARSASRSICRSTSAISRWSMRICEYSDKPFMGSVTKPERAERHACACASSCSARISSQQNTVLHEPHQRQFAARLGFDHARRGRGLRAKQSGLHHHALHPVGRDEPGHGRGNPDAGARRSAWPAPPSSSSRAPARR